MRVIILVCLVVSLSCNAQKADKDKPIVDETWVVKSGEKKFRVLTYNDEIYEKLFVKYQYDSCTKSISGTQKVDKRHNLVYWEYSIYFLNEKYAEVIDYLKNNFK